MENEQLPLGRRVPGATRAGPTPSARPVLTEAVLRQMQAAVDAAKAEMAAQEEEPDPDPEPVPRAARAGQANGADPMAAGRNADLNRDNTDKTRAKRKKAAAPVRPDRSFHKRNRAEPVEPSAPPGPDAPATATEPWAPERAAATSTRAGLPLRRAAEPALPAAAAAPPTANQAGAPLRPAVEPSVAGLPKRTAPPSRTAPPERAAAERIAAERIAAERIARETTETTTPLARLPLATPPAPPESRTMPGGTDIGSDPELPQIPANPAPAALRDRTAPQQRMPPPERPAPGQDTAPPKRMTAPKRMAPPTRTVPTPARPEPGTGGPATRRIARQQNLRPPRRRRSITLPLVGAAVVVLAAGGTFALLSRSAPPSRTVGLTVQQRAEQKNEAIAAAWIAEQVSRTTRIACDPQMCKALEARGFPAGDTQPLGPTSPVPTGSTLVVDTAAVQDLFGTSLAVDYAPSVLTTIGSGQAEIAIRVVAPHGTVKYDQQLAADLVVRKQYGQALAGASRVNMTAAAKAELTSGQVDVRLVLAITAVAIKVPVDIVDFGNVATDPSSGLPLRYVDLAEKVQAAHLSPAAYVKAVIAALKSSSSLPGPYLWTETLTVGAVPVLRIDYAAPSPLNIVG